MERAAPLIERTFLKTAPSWLPWFRSTSRHATLHYFCRKICPRVKSYIFTKLQVVFVRRSKCIPQEAGVIKIFSELVPNQGFFAAKQHVLSAIDTRPAASTFSRPSLTNSCVLHRQTAHADINQNCGLVSNMTSIVTSDLPSSILSL